MSEIVNNREYRQKVLKKLIMELHQGKSVDEVKNRFAKLIEGVSPTEKSEMEQKLIEEGLPVTEVQRLCDVHAAVFKGSIAEIHRAVKSHETPEHLVQIFQAENRKIEELIARQIKPYIQDLKEHGNQEAINKLVHGFKLMRELDRHYSRKENLLFPYIEKYGITGPPKVMWGVDNEIREGIRQVNKLLGDYTGNCDAVIEKMEEVIAKVLEMISLRKRISCCRLPPKH